MINSINGYIIQIKKIKYKIKNKRYIFNKMLKFNKYQISIKNKTIKWKRK